MNCPYCGSDETKVIECKTVRNASLVRRRRECIQCGRKFTTQERVEEMPLIVIKNTDISEPFNRNKLRESIVRACIKRSVQPETIERVVSEIENELQEYIMEVPTRTIVSKMLQKLLSIDAVAYIRYASVYYQYQDIETFLNELKEIKEKTAAETLQLQHTKS
ncbi:MAG: transcriptional regulator NrdR [Elusimicrobiota bacterium]